MDDNVITRRDVLFGIDDTELMPPDFYGILEASRRSWTQRESDGPQARLGSSDELVKSLNNGLNSFREVSEKAGLPLYLLELAIIDDDTIEAVRAFDPTGSGEDKDDIERGKRKQRQMYVDALQPRFVSVLASYGDFANDERLLRAWSEATTSMVSGIAQEGRAVVGTLKSYDYLCMWQRWTDVTPPRMLLGDPSAVSPWERAVTVSTDPKTLVVPPITYRLGRLATAELVYHKVVTETNPVRTSSDLLSYFRSTAAATFGAQPERLETLTDAVLLVVPFLRPRLYSAELSRSESTIDHAADQPGGGLFLLCKNQNGLGKEELREQLLKLAIACRWFLSRGTMLEARRERQQSRDQDLAQYGHLLTKNLRIVKSSAALALSAAQHRGPGWDESVLAQVRVTEREADRLVKISETARKAVRMANHRSARESFNERLSPEEFEAVVGDIATDTREYLRLSKIDEVWNAIEKTPIQLSFTTFAPGTMIETSRTFLASILMEAIGNALHHSWRAGDPVVTVNFFVFKDRLRATIKNKFSDDVARDNVQRMIYSRKLFLGLWHMKLLSDVYGLKGWPDIDIDDADGMFRVEAVLGSVRVSHRTEAGTAVECT